MRFDLKNTVRQARQYRVYRQLLASCAMLVLTAVFLASLFLTGLYAGNAIRESERRTLEQLSQIDYSLSVIYKQAEAISYAINEDYRIIRLLSLTDEDKVAKYQAQLELSKYRALYSYIVNISVINLRGELEANCRNTVDDSLFFAEHWKLGSVSVVNRTIYPLLGDNKTKGIPVVSLLFSSKNNNGGVIIDIDASLFEGYLRASQIVDNAIVALVDETGRIVLSAGSNELPETIPETRSVEYRLLNGALRQIAGLKLSSFGWHAYRLEPVGSMLASYGGLLRNTLVVTVLVAAVGITLASVLVQKMHSPIARLLDKTSRPKNHPEQLMDEYGALDEAFSEMRCENERTLQAYREIYLAGFLGLSVPTNDPGKALGLAENGIYLTLAIAEEQSDASSDALHTYAMASVVRDVLCCTMNCETARSENRVLALLQLSADRQATSLPLALDELQARLRERYNIRAIIAVGDTVHSLSDISDSANAARARLAYAYYFGSEIITAERISAFHAEEYPGFRALETQFTEAIRTNTPDKLLQTAALLPPDENRRALARLLQTQADRVNISLDDPIADILICPRYTAVCSTFSTCLHLLHTTEANRMPNRNRQIARQILEYIEANYMNEDLSLQSAAAEIGLSPGYIGKIFKSIYKESFGDCLTRVRMTEAHRMLLESDTSVSEITRRVGISNAAYFSTLFRKTYGMPPSALREQQKP